MGWAALLVLFAIGKREALIVGLYVVFLLIEARRLSKRVENGFSSEQSKRIAETMQKINAILSGVPNERLLAELPAGWDPTTASASDTATGCRPLFRPDPGETPQIRVAGDQSLEFTRESAQRPRLPLLL